MKIRINGADADIRPDTEKTVGEILSVMESWLSGSGHRLSGLNVDGEMISAESMEACFTREIDTIDTMDISTSSLPQLLAESLMHLLQDTEEYEAAGFEEKALFAARWRESPQACMLAEQNPVFFEMAENVFSGRGIDPESLRKLTVERLRELQDPSSEFGKLLPLVENICLRLEELPLDLQTGKDTRAADTISLFSGVTEKILRIINVLKMEGYPVGEVSVNNMPINAYIAEFDSVLRQMLNAYEQRDIILVGDLAEYEMAPRLRTIHSSILNAAGD